MEEHNWKSSAELLDCSTVRIYEHDEESSEGWETVDVFKVGVTAPHVKKTQIDRNQVKDLDHIELINNK